MLPVVLQPVDKPNKSPAEMYARPGILSSSDKYFVQASESQKPVTIIERLNVRRAPLLNLTWLSNLLFRGEIHQHLNSTQIRTRPTAT